MGYISGMNREQAWLFPEILDDDMAETNPVRCIDADVESLDLAALGFTHAVPKDTGRPAYAPADLLKLYIYGYLTRIRSSRKLEPETHRHVEVRWLLGKLTPDLKTIADFRKDHAHALKHVCGEFTLLCKRLDLFGRELLAIDGSKFKAVNHKDRHVSEKKLKQLLKHIHEKIAMYLQELDQQDIIEAQANHPTAEELKAQRLQLQARKHHYEHLLQHLATSGASPISLTDADRRSMKTNQGTDVCSHGQLAGAQQHKLIVAHEVTNAVTDQDQLATMAIRAKDTLETDHLEAIADMGYDDGDEGKKCLDEGMVPYSSKPNTSANRKLGLFGKDDFAYAAQNDGDPCPAGQFLTFRFEAVEQGRHIRYYSTSACQRCLLKPPCTRNKENRRITRWVHESIMEDRQQRVIANPAKVR